MRHLLLLALALVVVAGCKKAPNKPSEPTPAPVVSNGQQPAVHAPTGVVINPGAGGGSGGAAQAVRKAAYRAVSQSDLAQIRLFIENASLASGQMPTAQETAAALQKEAPGIYKQVEEGKIVLTGTRSREGIWAYTADAQSVTGEHLVLTKDGVQRRTPQALNQELRQ